MNWSRIKVLKKAGWLLFLIFVSMNVMAFVHAYKSTHFSQANVSRTADPKLLTAYDKAKILLTGIDNPKPQAKTRPALPYDIVKLKGTETLSCWHVRIPDPKGTIILFRGYAAEKSSLTGRSKIFNDSGYSTLLVDFSGSGDSSGSSTSVGFNEASEVSTCVDFLKGLGEENIILFGTSMGAAAILKAIPEFKLKPSAIIIECPFGSLYKTTCARFQLMGVPSFPMAALLTFWGGVQHGYWAFAHNPSTYAKDVACPVLLLFGEQDDRVSRGEINLIFDNLQGAKTLKTYPAEGHNFFVSTNEVAWRNDVNKFLTEIKTPLFFRN